MKLIKILAIGFVLLSLNACNNDDEKDFENIGTILGPDLTLSACSGGYVVDIENDENSYRIESVPEKSGINLNNSTFPVTIRFNWKLDRTCGSFKYMIIDDLELVK